MANYFIQELPDMHEGKKLMYPKMKIYNQMGNEKMAELVHKHGGSASKGAAESVLVTLPEVIKEYLSMGHTVKIEGLGTFSLSVRFNDDKSNALDTSDEQTTYRHVEVSRVNFKADPNLLRNINTEIKWDKVMTGVKRIKKTKYSLEQRIQRALARIEKYGYISLQEYATMNGLSRTAASNELRQLSEDPESPIRSRGTAPHRVWCKRE